jgi:hypothetical protein
MRGLSSIVIAGAGPVAKATYNADALRNTISAAAATRRVRATKADRPEDLREERIVSIRLLVSRITNGCSEP